MLSERLVDQDVTAQCILFQMTFFRHALGTNGYKQSQLCTLGYSQ